MLNTEVLNNAETDCQTLEAIMNSNEFTTVMTRLGRSVPSVAKVIYDLAHTVLTAPDYKGAQGNPGGNVMAIGLFTAANGLNIPVGTDLVRTSGHTTVGVGIAEYVADAAVDAAYVAGRPYSSFVSANGRGFKLSRADVRPEQLGCDGNAATDQTARFRAALVAASERTGLLTLTGGNTYTISSEIQVPVGVSITGPRSASIRMLNQLTTTTTTATVAGTAAQTFTVVDASAFRVGMSVMLFNGSTISPNDSYSHAGRQISAIAGNNVTIAAGPQVSVHASGATMATTAHLLLCQGDNRLSGFTVDGNGANNTYAHWITSIPIVQEGSRVRLEGLYFKNTPSDAFLSGAPLGTMIEGSWVIDCDFENIGSNGIHFGQTRTMVARGNRLMNGNMRYALPVEQGGGASAGAGHQDGAVIFSNDCYDLVVTENTISNWVKGAGAFGTQLTTGNINDRVTVTANTFIDCYQPLQVQQGTKNITFANNTCIAQFPFNTGTHRWAGQQIEVIGDVAEGRCQNININNNRITNGRILVDRVLMGQINGNNIDNRAINGSAYTAAQHYCMMIYNYEGLQIKGNVTMGGYISLWLQNGNLGYCRDTIIEGNEFLNPYQRALSGTASGGSTFEGTVFRGNIGRADTNAKLADGVTAIPLNTSGGWRGWTVIKGLLMEANRMEFNNAGAQAYDTGIDPATNFRRRWNITNGVPDLPPEYADDAAAATALVPIGAFYKTGSALKQRVA